MNDETVARFEALLATIDEHEPPDTHPLWCSTWDSDECACREVAA